MKFTNVLGMPQPIADAVMHDEYDRGAGVFASVSELCAPTRIAVLRRLHDAEIVEDVADRLHLLRGRLVHRILAEHASPQAIVEQRFQTEIIGPATGKRFLISGQVDHFEDGVLSDWKNTSKYTVLRAHQTGSVGEEWVMQLHGYRLLLDRTGHAVTSMRDVLLLDDWKRAEARRQPDLPQHGYAVVDVPVQHGLVETLAYLGAKAEALDAALRGESPPVCTREERWQDPTRYAARKPENKNATKVYDTHEEAAGHAARVPGMIVETRPSVPKRCADYCAVAAFCDWWQTTGGNEP